MSKPQYPPLRVLTRLAPDHPAAHQRSPALSADDICEGLRLVHELSRAMHARIATNDIEGTWSGVFVPCIWLATQMHRQRALIPTLLCLAVRVGPFQKLGEHLDALRLTSPAHLAAWINSLPPQHEARGGTDPMACSSCPTRILRQGYKSVFWRTPDKMGP